MSTKDGSNTLRVFSYFVEAGATNNTIKYIKFADGTTWTYEDVRLAWNQNPVSVDGGVTLEGNDDDNSLSGGSGNDILIGNGGNDNISAGSGNDTILAGTGDDYIDGGSGAETILIIITTVMVWIPSLIMVISMSLSSIGASILRS